MSDGKQTPVLLQTLSRGLQALEVLAESDRPMSIGELARRLELHRSITYRVVRTLEAHRLVGRQPNGDLRLGASLATLARNVSRSLQTAALPELTRIANELGMTAFLAIHDENDAVTLVSVEPRADVAAVAQRPGTRHALANGAPGRAVRRILDGDVGQLPYEVSRDEVIDGLSSVAVPLDVPGQQAAAIAVVYLSRPVDVPVVAGRLAEAARAICDEIR